MEKSTLIGEKIESIPHSETFKLKKYPPKIFLCKLLARRKKASGVKKSKMFCIFTQNSRFVRLRRRNTSCLLRDFLATRRRTRDKRDKILDKWMHKQKTMQIFLALTDKKKNLFKMFRNIWKRCDRARRRPTHIHPLTELRSPPVVHKPHTSPSSL